MNFNFLFAFTKVKKQLGFPFKNQHNLVARNKATKQSQTKIALLPLA